MCTDENHVCEPCDAPLPRDVQVAIARIREDDYYVPGGSGLAQLDGETLADYIEGKS